MLKYNIMEQFLSNEIICDVIKSSNVLHKSIISFNPNIISLLSSNGIVSFERVKYIKDYEESVLGRVFGVVCGNCTDDNQDRTYTIVVR